MNYLNVVTNMFEIKNFDNWVPYEGLSEGSGRSEKIWLTSGNNEHQKIGLFKYPKIDPSGEITTEHISEHLSYHLGQIVHQPTAVVDLGIYHGRIGSMSYLVNKSNQMLLEGVNFITGVYPEFDPETMQDAASGQFYCLDQILSSTQLIVSRWTWVKMMMFDFLIGNTDRHQSNWAILVSLSEDNEPSLTATPCPLYDNGSSLCCYITEQMISKYFGKDPGPMKSLVDSQSRSIIRINGASKKRPPHSDMVRYLLKQFDETFNIAGHFVLELTDERIDSLLEQYPESILFAQKNALIRKYLKAKIMLLRSILEEYHK